LPVDSFGPKAFKEGGGLVQQFGTVALVALQKRTANAENPADSLRVDIPKDEVPYESRRLEDIKYLDTGKPDWIEMKPILGVVSDALKEAGKN
jgi:hypothetical protein